MNIRVPLADLDYGDEEETAVLEVLRSKWLTMGATTKKFEQQFAAKHQASFALAVANATVALHLACVALDIGPEDEVILPSLTFVATANAVLYTGAAVRFADIIGPHDLTVDPTSIAAQITPRTKAIIVMHYAGFPCRMPEIMTLAQENGLAVIEDAAHAPGAALRGTPLGSWGDVGCFSFFSNKNLATGEGGMLITSREDVAERVRHLRSHGMTSFTWDRHRGHAYSYDVIDLGYNYRIDEIHAALGLVQLEKLSHNNQRRAQIATHYRKLLADSAIDLPFLEADGLPSHHIFPIILPQHVERLRLIGHMRNAGVQTSIHYPPIHQFAYYRRRFGRIEIPKTEAVAARELTIPLYPTMHPEMVRYVVETLQKGLEVTE
ncbi:MAG: aminotransferase DegT [Ardenticatenaceae bacterium]|nr:MAG: aminotransferase DegT [Ardenticatenaceae bacterium]